jgi:hypothetical protein
MGQLCGDFDAEGNHMIASSFHALYTLNDNSFTDPLSEIVLPSCVPSGIRISLVPQAVSIFLRVPRAACEMVIHSVLWISCPIFLNFGCLLTTIFRIKSPLGPF